MPHDRDHRSTVSEGCYILLKLIVCMNIVIDRGYFQLNPEIVGNQQCGISVDRLINGRHISQFHELLDHIADLMPMSSENSFTDIPSRSLRFFFLGAVVSTGCLPSCFPRNLPFSPFFRPFASCHFLGFDLSDGLESPLKAGFCLELSTFSASISFLNRSGSVTSSNPSAQQEPEPLLQQGTLL